MAAVITQNLVLGQNVLLTNGNAGVLGYENAANFGNISATSETDDNPVTNLINPATAFAWQASSNADQTITINTDGAQVDFIGIARHNLDQDGLSVTVKFNTSVVVPQQAVTNEQVVMYVVNSAAPGTVTIEIKGATDPATIAVLYVGKAVKLERNIYVGHTPITMAREVDEITGVSQSGEYLGTILKNQTRLNQVSLKNLTPQWYRENLDPYFAQVPRVPAFFAWRPVDYPTEVGYVWLEGNPKPVNQRNNGMMQIDWTFRGLA
jgi:hypothetical protein